MIKKQKKTKTRKKIAYPKSEDESSKSNSIKKKENKI